MKETRGKKASNGFKARLDAAAENNYLMEMNKAKKARYKEEEEEEEELSADEDKGESEDGGNYEDEDDRDSEGKDALSEEENNQDNDEEENGEDEDEDEDEDENENEGEDDDDGEQEDEEGEAEKQHSDDDQEKDKDASSKVKGPLTLKKLKTFQAKQDKTGVVYLSRIPPYMKPDKVRHLLSKHGKIGRIYLTPEDPAIRKKRKAMGGNKKQSFVDGWVEFEDKAVAKRVATTLNTTPIGGKQFSFYSADLWNIK